MSNKTENSVSNWYQITDFIWQKRQWVALYTLLSTISFVSSAIYSLQNSAAGEAFAFYLTLISGALMFGLVGMCAAAGIGFAAFFSALLLGWSINRVAEEWRLAAIAKQLPQYDGGDHLYIHSPDNTAESLRRLDDIERALPDGQFLGTLIYRNPQIIIIQKSRSGTNKKMIADRKDFVPEFAQVDFLSETPQTFLEYAKAAQREFIMWCANERAQLSGATLYEMAQRGLKTSYAIIALLLFSLPAFAQTKTERVNMGLGAAAQTVPQQGKVISYTFAKGTITRHADGVNTVAGLINAAGRVGSDADNMGELTGVDIAGLAINAVPQTKQPQPEKPKPLFQSRIESAVPVLPDSTTFEQDLHGAENYFDAQYTVLNQMFGKVWASRLTGTFINLILILFLLSVFFSNICNNEVIINRGRTYNAKLSAMAQFFMFVAFVLGIVAVTPILAGAMWYVLEGYIGSAIMVVLQWKAIVTVIMLLIMRSLVVKFVDWLFVAPKQNNGAFHDHGGNGGNYPTKR